MDREHDIFRCILNSRENGSNHSWNDALQLNVLNVWTLHRVGLAGGCLAIGENSSVEAIQDALDNGLGSRIVDFFLRGLHSKDVVEREVGVLL